SFVAVDGVQGERDDEPADRREEKLRMGLQPEAQAPEQQDADREPLNHQKIRSAPRAGGERAEHENGQHQSEDPPLRPFVQSVAIHQLRDAKPSSCDREITKCTKEWTPGLPAPV